MIRSSTIRTLLFRAGAVLLLAAFFQGGTARVSAMGRPEEAKDVAAGFLQYLSAGDIRAALEHFGDFPSIDKARLSEVFTRVSARYKERNFTPKVVKSKVAGKVAVVAFLDGPTDPDPIYLIQNKEGRWLIFSAGDFEVKEFNFPPATVATLAELTAWFKAEKPAIKDELRKETTSKEAPPK